MGKNFRFLLGKSNGMFAKGAGRRSGERDQIDSDGNRKRVN